MSARRNGFSLIEVIVAMVILSVGILAMGASTGFVLTQVRAAELRTDRMTAVQQAVERLRGVDWDDLEAVCGSQSFTLETFTVSCSVSSPPGAIHLKRVQLVSTGPGYRGGKLVRNVADTTAMGVARPLGS
jgi:prepilin-type N-terminal cleavage/methylation domain-containing protein